jgi:hypothetical protein
VSDVACALAVSAEKVRAWIDDGSVESIDIGTDRKPLYRISRESVVELIEKLGATKEKRR